MAKIQITESELKKMISEGVFASLKGANAGQKNISKSPVAKKAGSLPNNPKNANKMASVKSQQPQTMAVSESELKNIIKESVISVLNEKRWNNYGMNWGQLSDAEKQAYAERYGNSAGAGYYADENGNRYNNGGYAGGQYTRQYDMDKLGEYYAQQQQKKGGRSNRNGFSKEYVDKLQADFNKTKTQLSQAQNLNNGYKSAIDQINQALSQQVSESAIPPIDSSLAGAPDNAAPTPEQNAAMNTKSAVPNLAQILQNIENLKTAAKTANQKVAQLTKANQTLTAQNKSLAGRVQNAQNPVKPVAPNNNLAATATVTPPAAPSGLAGQRPGTAQA